MRVRTETLHGEVGERRGGAGRTRSIKSHLKATLPFFKRLPISGFPVRLIFGGFITFSTRSVWNYDWFVFKAHLNGERYLEIIFNFF